MKKDGPAYIIPSSNDMIKTRQMVVENTHENELLIELNTWRRGKGWQTTSMESWIHVSISELEEVLASIKSDKLRKPVNGTEKGG